MSVSPTTSAAPPNILYLLGESHAPGLLGCLGNRYIRTPNLDRLAERGMVFDAAYCASPLCVPARAALATGRFPHQTGFWDSSSAYDGRVDSWMKRLRGAGYETVGIGKMHYRSDEDDYGFSRFIETMHIVNGTGDLVSALRCIDAAPASPGLWDIWTSRYGAGDDNPYRQYDERIVNEATNWLEGDARQLNRPWALCVHFIAAHAPFITPQVFQEMYEPADVPLPFLYEKGERPNHPWIKHLRKIVPHDSDFPIEAAQKVRAAYFATVTYLDSLVGRLLDTLKAEGMADNTLIVYTSDHGFSLGEHFLFGLFHLFEESVKVPMIMAGPGIPAASHLKKPVSHVDLYPTILKACGVPLNQDDRELPGESLWPLINGKASTGRPVFAEYHGIGTRSGGFVIRDGKYKLIYFVGMPPQLFDLRADPHEATDLALEDDFAPVLETMIGKLHDVVDPEAVDAGAKDDQRRLIERHGGKDKVLHDMGDFSHSPPPGHSWRSMVRNKD